MLLRFLLFIAFTCAVQNVVASKEPADTLISAKELTEVTVTASQTQQLESRTVYFPPKSLVSATNNAIQLIAGLQIPDLITDPATGTIEKTGPGKMAIRINGRPASTTDLITIASKDIVKVEYTSEPGVRYGDAGGVLDITVRRHETGYGVAMNVLQSANRGWGNYTGAIKYNSGRSEWSIDLHSNPMWHMNAFRDNYEHFTLSDGTPVIRMEDGVKAPNRMATHKATLQYSYATGNAFLFNTQLRVSNKNDRYISKGEITTMIDNNVTIDFETEELPTKSTQWDLDIYIHKKIDRKHKIYLNIVPTRVTGSSDRIYKTFQADLQSGVSELSHKFLMKGVWENRIKGGVLSSGIKSIWNRTNATYRNPSVNTKERDAHNYAFIEWRHISDKLQYNVGIGATMYSITKPTKGNYVSLNPRLYLRYTPRAEGGLSLAINIPTVIPSVIHLNPVMQQVDSYQWSKGNKALSPYQRYETKIEIDGRLKDVTGKVTIGDSYSQNPVMGAKTYEDDMIVKSYYNSGYNNDFSIKAQLRIPLLLKGLTLSLEGGWHTTVSKGINYRHTYSQPFINAQIMLLKGSWWGMIKYNSTYNVLWGEEIGSVNNNTTNIGIGHTFKNLTFMIGALNPVGNISLKSRDLSRTAGYDRMYQVSSTRQLLWMGITLNLHRGKKRPTTLQKLNNTNSYKPINTVKK